MAKKDESSSYEYREITCVDSVSWRCGNLDVSDNVMKEIHSDTILRTDDPWSTSYNVATCPTAGRASFLVYSQMNSLSGVPILVKTDNCDIGP